VAYYYPFRSFVEEADQGVIAAFVVAAVAAVDDPLMGA